MKKLLILLLVLLLPVSAFAQEDPTLDEAMAVLAQMQQSNTLYVSSEENGGDISAARREDTAHNGQEPYAVVVTCSDSRVPAEHIFGAGIGELFVIRTAGNVIGDFELGSVEYGAEHLHTPLVVVMGHTGCGAVDAALHGGAHGYIGTITSEILSALPENCTAEEAEILNVQNSLAKIRQSPVMQELEEADEVVILGAIYDIDTGYVAFLEQE